jgi:flagellar protein FliS
MNYYGNRGNVYQEISVQTSSPAKLVVMLYEGGIRFLRQSIDAMQAKDLDRKRQSIDRAVAIIQHLHDTLDTAKGGQLAADLDKLYTYITSRILDGSAKLQTKPLEEAIKLLTTLLTGWEEVVKKEQEHTVPTVLLAQQAAERGFSTHA